MSFLPPNWASACGGAEAIFCPQGQLKSPSMCARKARAVFRSFLLTETSVVITAARLPLQGQELGREGGGGGGLKAAHRALPKGARGKGQTQRPVDGHGPPNMASGRKPHRCARIRHVQSLGCSY
jgi:hypothetical protein